MTISRTVSRGLALTAAVGLALGLSACSTAASPPPSASSTANANAIHDMLPQDIKDKGVIVVATDPQFGPPTNYRPLDKPNDWAGIEPDILAAIEPVLGVKLQHEQATFTSIIPGVKSGRYDLGSNALGITAERLQQVDMISLWTGTNKLVVRKGNPQKIAGLKDLCGKQVAVVQGDPTQTLLTDWSAKNCAGTEMQLVPFGARPDALVALSSDKVVATVGGDGFLIRLINNLDGNSAGAADLYQVLDIPVGTASPSGFAVAKDRAKLRDAVAAAVQKIMDDGTYEKIMLKWHWPKEQILTKTAVNPTS